MSSVSRSIRSRSGTEREEWNWRLAGPGWLDCGGVSTRSGPDDDLSQTVNHGQKQGGLVSVSGSGPGRVYRGLR